MESKLIPYSSERAVGRGPALVFAPHPDDEVFGCAGAIMRHVEAGESVTVIVITDGAYEPGPADDARAYGATREQESIAAAAVLGYGQPVFWRLPDRGLVFGEKLIHRLVQAIEEHRPGIVYAPSLHEAHPDHRVLAMAAVEAVRRAKREVRLAMYEVGMPLAPNLLLDISDLVERKEAAMRCFPSQLARQPYDQHIAALNRYRTYTLARDVTAAEAYFLASSGELQRDALVLYDAEYRRQSHLGLRVDRDHPLVSVIIRSVGRDTLNRSLDSVALQVYPNIEVLVVNAKGPDHPELGEWCGRFPMRVIGDGSAMRRSRAANLGLDQAAGKYLILLDDDDWFLPNHISSLVQRIESGDGATVAYSGVRCLRKTPDGRWEHVYTFDEEFDRTRLLCQNFVPIHSALFARELVAQGCRFDENLDIYEDWDFWIQCSQRSNFLRVESISAIYRISSFGGFGVLGSEQTIYEASVMVLNKWRHLWTDRQLFDLAVYARSNADDSRHQKIELQALRGQLDDLQAQYHLLSKHARPAVRELEVLKGSLEAARQELQLIHSSRSWRWTRPMRSVLGGLRITRVRAGGGLRRYRRYVGSAATILRTQGAGALVRKVQGRLFRRPVVPEWHAGEIRLERNVGPVHFPSFEAPDVSVVVFAHGAPEYTLNCLKSIVTHSGGVAYEALVAADARAAMTLSAVEGVRLLKPECMDDPSGCYAVAAEAARGDLLVFVHDYVVVTRGWLTALLNTVRRDPSVALAVPKMVSDKGTLLSAGGLIEPDGRLRDRGEGEQPHAPAFNYRARVDYGGLSCFLVRRDLFLRAGGVGHGAGDEPARAANLALKLRDAGQNIVCQPVAVAACFTDAPGYPGAGSGVGPYVTSEFLETWKAGTRRDAADGKRLLVIDGRLLTPDQDSGSLRMYKLLEIFQGFGYAATFIPATLEYSEMYASLLQEIGIEVLYAPAINSIDQYLEECGGRFDVVMLSRVDIADRFIHKVKQCAPGAFVIFDTVDLHYLRERRQAMLEASKSRLKQAELRKAQELGVAARADVTFVVSEIEKEIIRQDAPQLWVEVLSNIHEIYGRKVPFAQREGILFIGGFDHPPNVDAVLYFVNDILPIVRRLLPGTKVYIVGSNPPSEIRALASDDVIVTGYVADLSLYFDRCRVSIAPLRYGAGVKGKVNMSMSYGVPVVATAIAVEGMHLVHGESAMVADEPKAFAEALAQLYQDEALWTHLSDNSIGNVEDHFSVAAATRALREVLAFKGLSS